MFISGCSKSTEIKSLEVEIWLNGSPLTCSVFEDDQHDWSIQQLAFFMSDVAFSGNDTEIQTQLITTPWQTDDVVLIQPNFADCKTGLADGGKVALRDVDSSESLQVNNHLQFSMPIDVGTSERFSFTLAVPFALNHQNPLLQASPLNLPSMFWSWRSGHKFFRLDMQSPSKNWVFHLGSVGCVAVSTMRSPLNECVQPNRISFNLDKKHNGTKVVLHLDRLIANTSMQNSESCLFHSGQKSCTVLMSNLKTQEVFEWH